MPIKIVINIYKLYININFYYNNVEFKRQSLKVW